MHARPARAATTGGQACRPAVPLSCASAWGSPLTGMPSSLPKVVAALAQSPAPSARALPTNE
eukprot:11066888-Lingulodinium_polyedra.AAC.1